MKASGGAGDQCAGGDERALVQNGRDLAFATAGSPRAAHKKKAPDRNVRVGRFPANREVYGLKFTPNVNGMIRDEPPSVKML